MKNQLCRLVLLLPIASLCLIGCSKSIVIPDSAVENSTSKNADTELKRGKPVPSTSTFTSYTIQAGNHSCDQSTLKSVKTSEMKFVALFDQSAIYTSIIPGNQYDIHKLYGFSEGFNNQYNSARIGWNWYNEALHLHAYVYNKGVRMYQEIKTVAIGAEIQCSIKVSGSSYIFTVDGTQVTMSRGLSTSSASGYQQYPYFGGDEVAPHKVTIKIKNL
jgi:hypothetical protein